MTTTIFEDFGPDGHILGSMPGEMFSATNPNKLQAIPVLHDCRTSRGILNNSKFLESSIATDKAVQLAGRFVPGMSAIVRRAAAGG